ncbi:MAG: hypothetical protein Q8936_13240 [Bacillota bacterium]|nr:hypothetical protein [Bacillota bacterium]
MRKIVIVYDRMGMGHLRMAKIIENILKEDNNVEIILTAATDFIDTADCRFAVKFWNYGIKKNWITILDLLINFGLRKFLMPVMDVKYTKKVYTHLDALQPDIIISTFNVINKALGTYAEEKGIPFHIFVLDIAIFLDLANPYAKHICYFDETAEAIRNYDFNTTYYTNKINEKVTPLEKIKYVIKYYKDYVFNSAKIQFT